MIIFEVFEQVADAAVGEGFDVFLVAEFAVFCVGLAGLDGVLFECLDGVVEELVVLGVR